MVPMKKPVTLYEQAENFRQALRDLRDAVADAARKDLRRFLKMVRG